jgi:DNA-binding MarR family transcriptional regulator
MPGPQKALSDTDYRALAEFRYLLRQFLAFSETAAQKEGLAPQQHQALLAIKGFGGTLTIGELAEKLMIKPHSAAELVDRLVLSGHLRKEADRKDRRRTHLSLTPAAERRLRSLSQAHRSELGRMTPLLKLLLQSWETTNGG